MNDERRLIMAIIQISNLKSRMVRWLARMTAPVAVVLAALADTSVGYAQTCPYCYANAAAQTPGMLQALKTGVLVIMLPCLAMFIVIFAVAYRRRESYNADGTIDLEVGSVE